MSDSVYRRWLIVILAAGVAARLLVALAIPAQPVSDFWEYLRSAQSLATTGRYEAIAGAPNVNHPPGYPLLLSGAFRLVPDSADLLVAKTVNALLAALAAFLGALFARRFWGNAAALCTAAWFAFLPRSLLMSDLIASENLFSPMWMLFLLLSAIAWTSESTGPRRAGLLAATGAVVGLLALTRSEAYLLPLVWIAGMIAARKPVRSWAAGLLLILAVEHIVLLPWGIRNERVLGRFTFLNAVGGVSLLIGNNPHATGRWYDAREDLERARPDIGQLKPLAADAAARREAIRWMCEHPLDVAKLYAHKLYIVATDDAYAAGFAIFGELISPPEPPASVLPGPHWLKGHRKAVVWILRISALLLAAAALGGFVQLMRRALRGSLPDRALAAGLGVAAVYFPLLCAVVIGSDRHRWPAEDAIMPLAGFMLAGLGQAARRRIPIANIRSRRAGHRWFPLSAPHK